MEKLTAIKAIELLFKDVIIEKSDLEKSENRWMWHCIYVGRAAKRIANKLGLDGDYAMALGCAHDIGRKISHPNHPVEGYKYMIEQGYPKEAEICLSHSFIDNDINLVAGGAPSDVKTYEYINEFLQTTPPTIYDNIIKLCDLFCLATGFTTIEKRVLDVYSRKGIYEYSYEHFKSVLELKNNLEKQMGCSLYDLFPEIDKKDIQNANEDSEKLMEMINAQNNTKRY